MIDIKIGALGLVSFIGDVHTSYTGAPSYNAPEQSSREYTSKVDIYTLALVMFEIMKKRFDLDFSVWENCLRKIGQNTKNLLKDFQLFESKKCRQLLEKMLAEDPDECCSVQTCSFNLIHM